MQDGQATAPAAEAPHNAEGERPIVNIVGELVALGPLRRDLLPTYQRWINDFGTLRTIGLPPRPMTAEQEQGWYDRQATAESEVPFTIYERATWRPVGNTGLHAVDYRNRSAGFGIMIGEADCRGKGYGTEATRLMLDYAFTALGLHSVMLTTDSFNLADSVVVEGTYNPDGSVTAHNLFVQCPSKYEAQVKQGS